MTTRYIIRIVEAWEGVEACVNICEMLLNAMRHVDHSDDSSDDDGDVVVIGSVESQDNDSYVVKVGGRVEIRDEDDDWIKTVGRREDDVWVDRDPCG